MSQSYQTFLLLFQKFTIPKAEKRKIVSISEEPEGKPVDFSGAIEARSVMEARSVIKAEVPDYFSNPTVSPPLPMMPSTSER